MPSAHPLLRSVSSSAGQALVMAIGLTFTVAVISSLLLSQSLNTDKMLKSPRIRSAMLAAQSRLRLLAVTPFAFQCQQRSPTQVGGATSPVCQLAFTPRELNQVIPGAECPEGVQTCGVEVRNLAFGNNRITANIEYTGVDLTFQSTPVEIEVPADVLQTSQNDCFARNPLRPISAGYLSDGSMDCRALPASCTGPGQYVASIDPRTLQPICATLPADVRCPGNSYITSMRWNGSSFDVTCAARPSPFTRFGFAASAGSGAAAIGAAPGPGSTCAPAGGTTTTTSSTTTSSTTSTTLVACNWNWTPRVRPVPANSPICGTFTPPNCMSANTGATYECVDSGCGILSNGMCSDGFRFTCGCGAGAATPSGDCDVQWYALPAGPTNDTTILLGQTRNFAGRGYTYIGSSLIRSGNDFTCPAGDCSIQYTRLGNGSFSQINDQTIPFGQSVRFPADTLFLNGSAQVRIVGTTVSCGPARGGNPLCEVGDYVHDAVRNCYRWVRSVNGNSCRGDDRSKEANLCGARNVGMWVPEIDGQCTETRNGQAVAYCTPPNPLQRACRISDGYCKSPGALGGGRCSFYLCQ